MTTINEDTILRPATKYSNNLFGRNVVSKGSYLLVTSNYLPIGPVSNAGAIYVFKNTSGTSWSQLTGLYYDGTAYRDFLYNNVDATNGHYYGHSLSIDNTGTYIVVGEVLYDDAGTEDGKLRIYKNNGSDVFVEESITQPSFISSGDRVGFSVEIEGDYLVVGANLDDTTDTSAGSAAIYKLSGGSWTEIQAIQGRDGSTADAQNNDQFGKEVAMYGDFIAVGAVNEGSYGAVYIYKNNGSDNFTSIDTMKISGTSSYQRIGDFRTVAMYGDYLLASSINTRNATLFKYNSATDNTWNLVTSFVASGIPSGYIFGFSASIYERTMIVTGNAQGFAQPGVAAVFSIDPDTDAVTEEYRLVQSTGAQNNSGYGQNCTVNGDHLFVGHSKHDTSGYTNDGAVYYFYQSVCFGAGSMVETENGSIEVENLRRGMMIVTSAGPRKLARVLRSTGVSGRYVVFEAGSVSEGVPSAKTVVTRGHVMEYEGDYYNSDDFAENSRFEGVSYVDMLPEGGLYTLQFETHEVIRVNGMKLLSLPPYTHYKGLHLPKGLYFNKEKFDEEHIGKMYKPYMLHDDPLPKNKLK